MHESHQTDSLNVCPKIMGCKLLVPHSMVLLIEILAGPTSTSLHKTEVSHPKAAMAGPGEELALALQQGGGEAMTPLAPGQIKWVSVRRWHPLKSR